MGQPVQLKKKNSYKISVLLNLQSYFTVNRKVA